MLLSTFTVTNTSIDPDVVGSLPWAINMANTTEDHDLIDFRIEGDATISLTDALPAITESVTIDGTTQNGSAREPLVTIDGTRAYADEFYRRVDGLVAQAGDVTIRGLAIRYFNNAIVAAGDNVVIEANQFAGNETGIVVQGAFALVRGNIIGDEFDGNSTGVWVKGAFEAAIGGSAASDANIIYASGDNGILVTNGAEGTVIAGNLIGLDPSGWLAGNYGDGIEINNALFTAITGNTIAGNYGDGIRLANAWGTLIVGNRIGVGPAGNEADFGNYGDGVGVYGDSTANIIGGATTGSGNIVSNNSGDGISFYLDASGTANIIQGNYIGTDITGTLDRGNEGFGASIEGGRNSIGGTGPGEGNTIAFNNSGGVGVYTGTANTIRGNSIFDNGGLGIDLVKTTVVDDVPMRVYGVTDNNSAGHAGPNLFQNFPAITSAQASGATLHIAGSFTGTPLATFTIDFYASASPDDSNHGEGQAYLGSVQITTDHPSGQASFNATVAAPAGVAWITATATDAAGNTSEFSLAVESKSGAVSQPTQTAVASSPNPSTYGQPITLTAKVTTTGGAPASGSIVFYKDGVELNAAAIVLDASGAASFATSSFTVGAYDLWAHYIPDNGFIDSRSATIEHRVNPADLFVTASSATRIYGQANPVFTATITGFVPGEDISSLDGTLAITTAATLASPVGAYAVTATGLSSSNYNISFTPGVLDITAAALTVTAQNASRLFGQENPTFTAAFDGFVLNEGPSALDGSLSFSTTATAASSVGSYIVTPGGLVSSNYTIDFVAGTLLVNAASTQTTLSASAVLVTLGQPVTLTANVAMPAPGGGSPAGMVTFLEGTTLLGTATVSDGAATLTLTSLLVGAHSVVAVYGGSGDHLGSESAPVALTVQSTAFNASGKIWRDLSGNGISSDDPGLGDILVQLFTDKNNNGKLEPSDGPAIASVKTSVESGTAGDYAFSIDGTGRYLIQAQVPSGYVRTFPYFDSFYGLQAAPGGSRADMDFALTRPCTAKADGVTVVYIINGVTTVTDLRGKVNEGDTVEARFTIAQQDTYRLTLVSYTAPGASFIAENADLQNIFQEASILATGPGTFSLTVDVPDSYFQIDAVCGKAIDRFGPAGSNIFYSAQNRLFSADNDGKKAHVAGSASIAGFIYLDADNDGVKDAGENAITGATVRLTGTNILGQSVTTTRTTDSRGRYVFTNLLQGSYEVVETQPAGYTDGLDSLGTGGGTVGNDRFTVVIDQPGANKNYNFGELRPASLSGYVFVDKNANGAMNSGEKGIGGVTLSLLNAAGQVVANTQTNSCGAYSFTNLLPGTYTLVETQPSGYVDGEEIAGSLGGDVSGDNNVIAGITVGAGQNGAGYYFTEYPEVDVTCGDAATISFWRNKNGQNLIKGLNGRQNSMALGNWLANTFPNIYGASSPNCMASKTNSQVASKFLSLFNTSGMKLDAQVMAVSLALYCTDTDLAGTAAKKYGFTVSATGTGMRTYNVGSSGAAFGVANHTDMLVKDILAATNKQAINGVLYNGDAILRVLANTVFDGINNAGDI